MNRYVPLNPGLAKKWGWGISAETLRLSKIARDEIFARNNCTPIPPERMYALMQVWTGTSFPGMGQRMVRARLFECKRHGKERVRSWAWALTACACLSQADVAKKLDLSRPVITDCENGKRVHFRCSIVTFWSVFGYHADYILTGYNSKKYAGDWILR